jgi:WD40 repeat protein
MNCNENILKLIITNLTLFKTKQLFDRVNNKQLAELILGKLDYHKVFKSLGESKIILDEHTKWINDLALLPNNKLASVSMDQKLKFWDLNEYKCLKTIEEDCIITSVITLPKLKIATSSKKRIKIFSIHDYGCIKTIELEKYNDFRNLLLLPDETMACIGYFQNKPLILIFDCNNDYAKIKQTALLAECIFRLINLSNNRVASSSGDDIIRIWDIKGCHCIKEIVLQNSSAFPLIFVERGNLLLSGADDAIIKVWSLETFQCIKNVEIKIDGIHSFLLLPNRYLACGSCDGGKIMILDLNNYECFNVFDEGNNSVVAPLKLLDDKRVISSGKKITIWNY